VEKQLAPSLIYAVGQDYRPCPKALQALVLFFRLEDR
jgi:hypothetical protein